MSSIMDVTVDPLMCGFWFRMRTIFNFALSIGICVVLVVAFALVFPTWIAEVAAALLTMYLYDTFLEGRHFRVICKDCRKLVSSDTPWICGFCTHKNEHTDDYPFIFKCEHCSAIPKAYKCHHCGELIYLSEDRLDTNFACCYTREATIPSPTRQIQRSEELREKEHVRNIAKIDAEVDALTKKPEVPQLKSISEQKREKLEKMLDAHLSAREWAQKKRQEIAVKFKDDPEALDKANELIDRFLEDEA